MYGIKSGIYLIENSVNNKKYIGSSVNIKKRINSHFSLLKNCKSRCKHLQLAYNKYGHCNFVVRILLFCDKTNLLFYEQKAIDFYKSYNSNYGYNICPIAGNTSGVIPSEETREKISKSLEGNKRTLGYKHSKETRLKMSKSRMGKTSWNKGVSMSNDYKEKMSKKLMGRVFTKEHREKISIALKGKKKKTPTKEHREKLSNSLMGRVFTKEHREKIGIALKNRIFTEEHRNNLSKKLKGRIPWNKGIKYENKKNN